MVNGSKKQNFFDIKFLTSSMRSLHSLHPLDHGGKEKNNRRVIKGEEKTAWNLEVRPARAEAADYKRFLFQEAL